MDVQLVSLGEPLKTNSTFKRLLPSVCSTVHLKHVPPSEPLWAKVTPEWPLTCMGSLVDGQIVSVSKLLETDVARDKILSAWWGLRFSFLRLKLG